MLNNYYKPTPKKWRQIGDFLLMLIPVCAGSTTVYAKNGTNIQYIMGYTSSGATSMQYELNITVIKIR